MENFKHFIKPDLTDVIPPLNKNGQIYTEEKEKANLVNNFFTEQTLLDDSQGTLPQKVKNTTYKLDCTLLHLKRLETLSNHFLLAKLLDLIL